MQKLKRPVSVILSILMVVSMFVVVPFTASAAGEVAEVNGTQYATLAAAIADAQAGDTVKLVANVTEAVSITGKTLTLDLNGFNITSPSSTQPIKAYGGTKLTITNSNRAKAENTPTQNAVLGSTGGANNYGSLFASGEGTEVIINAGYYYGYNGDKTAIHAVNKATVTFNDCVVNGAAGFDGTGTTGKEGKIFYSGVGNPTQPYAMDPGYIVVHGGTFSGRMSDSNWGNYLIDGGTFDRNVVVINANPVDANGNRVATASGNMEKIKDGTFYDSNWLAPGFAPVANGDGTFTVKEPYAARIGNTPYATFAEAVAARQSEDDVITLLANYSGTYTMDPGKLVVDKNGFTFAKPASSDPSYSVTSTNSGTVYTFTTALYRAAVLHSDNTIYYTNNMATAFSSNLPYGAQTGETVKLLQDVTFANQISTANTGVTLDLDGKTLTLTKDTDPLLVQSSKALTIKDGTINNTKAIALKENTTLNLDDATITGDINAAAGATITFANGAAITGDITVPEGYKVVTDATTGAKTVAPDYVASVNGSGYMTFAEAVAARESTNDVITLIKAAGTYTMTDVDEAPIKVQKDGKTVTVKAPAGEPYVVKSSTASGITTYTLAAAGVEYTNANGVVTYLESMTNSPSDGTYKLLKDYTTNFYIVPGTLVNNFTLDLNGFTYTSNSVRSGFEAAVLLSRDGTADSHKTTMIKNGTIVYTTANSPLSAVTITGDYNDVTIKNVTITSPSCGVQVTGDNQNVTIEDSTISVTGNNFALATNGINTTNGTISVEDSELTSTGATAVYLPGDADVTFTDTDITGTTGIYIKSGTVAIDGGTITGNGAAAEYTYDGSGCKATGDAIVVDSCGYPGGAPTVTISGNPTVTSTNGKQIGDYSYGNNALGTVTATSNTMTLPTGLKWVETDTPGVYEVGKKLFVGHNLLLGGDIGVNFYLNPVILDSYNGTKTVKFTCDGEETTVAVPATADAKGYKVTLNVVAARMAHKINAVVYVNNGSTALAETDSYSVQDYAEAVFAEPAKYTTNAKAPALKALAKAMLNYGAQAQNVFASSLKDKTPAPANTTVGNNGYSAVTVGDVQNAINGDASDLTAIAAQLNAEYYTSSLIYLQNNTLRIYFTPKSKQLGGLDGMGFDGNLSDYYYYEDVTDIAAAELDNQQTFTVNGVEFQYSALDYVVAVLNSNKMGPAQQNLAKSLFLYNQAANAYFD